MIQKDARPYMKFQIYEYIVDVSEDRTFKEIVHWFQMHIFPDPSIVPSTCFPIILSSITFFEHLKVSEVCFGFQRVKFFCLHVILTRKFNLPALPRYRLPDTR